ncbi:MAG: PPOX class F420-dependent oxidoreductase, partial [Acidimicrobiales bacterium]
LVHLRRRVAHEPYLSALTSTLVEVLRYRTMDTFTESELAYLAGQRLGRLATVDPRSAPQNSPVGFNVEPDGTVVIGGWNLGATRKFRNVVGNPQTALVVDDLASVDPWRVRGVEIRGSAEADTDVEPGQPWLSREQIRIYPERIISWGLDELAEG